MLLKRGLLRCRPAREQGQARAYWHFVPQPLLVMPPPSRVPFVNKQKQRKGWSRLWHAAGYSLHGLRAGWDEAAFRLEASIAPVSYTHLRAHET